MKVHKYGDPYLKPSSLRDNIVAGGVFTNISLQFSRQISNENDILDEVLLEEAICRTGDKF